MGKKESSVYRLGIACFFKMLQRDIHKPHHKGLTLSAASTLARAPEIQRKTGLHSRYQTAHNRNAKNAKDFFASLARHHVKGLSAKARTCQHGLPKPFSKAS